MRLPMSARQLAVYIERAIMEYASRFSQERAVKAQTYIKSGISEEPGLIVSVANRRFHVAITEADPVPKSGPALNPSSRSISRAEYRRLLSDLMRRGVRLSAPVTTARIDELVDQLFYLNPTLGDVVSGVSWAVGSSRVADAGVMKAIEQGTMQQLFDLAVALVQFGAQTANDVPKLINVHYYGTHERPGATFAERARGVLPSGYTSARGNE